MTARARGVSALAALVVAAAGARLPAVIAELRFGLPPVEVDVQQPGPEGPKVIGAERRIPWRLVRGVSGASGDAARAWLEAGEDLWRGLQRAERGDWQLALEPLRRAADRWEGESPSADGLLAAACAAEASVRAGRAADAVRHAFEAIRVAQVAPALRTSGDLPEFGAVRDAVLRYSDPAAALAGELSPTAFGGAESASIRASLARAVAAAPGVAALAGAYLGALEPSAAAVRAPGGAARDAGAMRAVRTTMEAIRDVRSPDAAVRRAAVRGLLDREDDALTPTCLFAAARALAAEPGGPARDAGRIILASVIADPGAGGPALAARAEAAFREPSPGSSMPAAMSVGITPDEALPWLTEGRLDAAAAFLERAGEGELLARLLDPWLAHPGGVDAPSTRVSRVAAALASSILLERDGARRERLRQVAEDIVDRHAVGSERLQLEILRSRSLAAQRIVESRRAGRETDASCASARAQLGSAAQGLDALVRRADAAVSQAESAARVADPADAERLLARAEEIDGIRREARSLRAWSLYGAAWLDKELGEPYAAGAAAAAEAFAGVIEPGKRTVDPKEVSEDLRPNRSFASAILGRALALSLAGKGSDSEALFALLQTPATHAAVRERVPEWRIAAALDRGDLPEALALLRGRSSAPIAPEAALVALATASRDADRAGAEDLLTESVAMLVAAGRIADLASVRSPTGAAASSAGARLLSAVHDIAEARRLRDAGNRDAAIAAWVRAAAALESAAAPGAPPVVASGARALRGVALREAGRLAEAADAFLAAAAGLEGDAAGDARWDAVLCLDADARDGGDPGKESASRRDREIDVIRRELPGTRAAVRAAAWRVSAAARPEPGDLDLLLADDLPPDLLPAARRVALDGLYRVFRNGAVEDRLAVARRALVAGDGIGAGAAGDGIQELLRRLELALAVGDRPRAEDSLAAIESRVAGSEAPRAQVEELRARRIQVALLAGRVEDARREFAAMPAEGPWTKVAVRALRDATFADASAPPRQRAVVARAVVLAGPAPTEPDILRWAAAETDLLRAGSESVDAAGAGKAIADGLAAAPSSLLLRLADASLRDALGDQAGAMRSLREVLARSVAGTPEWFQAKAIQVGVLAAEDPAKARAVLEQARRLGNGLGGGPAGDRLRSFDQSLPPTGDGGPSP